MKVVTGPAQDGSRTAFLFSDELERFEDRPRLLIAGAWCSCALGIGWLGLLVFAGVMLSGDPEFEGGGLAILPAAVVPFYGLFFAIRLLRNNDDVAAMIALVPLHLLGTPPMLVVAFVDPTNVFVTALLAGVAALTAAPPLLFWLDARSWRRS